MFWSDLRVGQRVSVVHAAPPYAELASRGEIVAVDEGALTIDTGFQCVAIRKAEIKTVNDARLVEPQPQPRTLLAIEVLAVTPQHPNGLRLQWLVVPESIEELADEPGTATATTSDGRQIRLMRSTIRDWREVEIPE